MQNRNVIDVDQLAFLWATLMTLIIVAQIYYAKRIHFPDDAK